mgnify:CR=1 FL=1|tara:strand:+ start:1027 stop:1191 length:165 start_codon:yes stop_codon:yes gene_type:complete
MKSKIKAGDLVNRGSMLMLVIEIGKDYYAGFALCRTVDSDPSEFWIDKSLLDPV